MSSTVFMAARIEVTLDTALQDQSAWCISNNRLQFFCRNVSQSGHV